MIQKLSMNWGLFKNILSVNFDKYLTHILTPSVYLVWKTVSMQVAISMQVTVMHINITSEVRHTIHIPALYVPSSSGFPSGNTSCTSLWQLWFQVDRWGGGHTFWYLRGWWGDILILLCPDPLSHWETDKRKSEMSKTYKAILLNAKYRLCCF